MANNPEFSVLPSGKHARNYGKSKLLMDKLMINGPSSLAMLNCQRVTYATST